MSNRKRNLDTIEQNSNKKIKIEWNNWISATSTRNSLLDDGFLDIIEYKNKIICDLGETYKNNLIKDVRLSKNDNFTSTIMKIGHKFEDGVIKLITDKVGKNNIINIGGYLDPRSDDRYDMTLKSIYDGIPIIYSGIIRNYKNQTYGIPDIIIRSDWIDKIINKSFIIEEDKYEKASKLSGEYHYRIIDIKFTTLHLKCDGIHLRNNSNISAYKGQLYIYNKALSKIQGYNSNISYILGSKWKYVSKKIEYKGNDCFDRLGVIDFKNNDKHIVKKLLESVDWLQYINKNIDILDLSKLPLIHHKLYPNMCNNLDFPYHNIKTKFAESINEITLLWQCGPKQRIIAHKNGIYSWKDNRCTPSILGFKPGKRHNILSRILEVNRDSLDNILPKHIENNESDWQKEPILELYVDFEMTCSVLNDLENLPKSSGNSIIYMIGVGYLKNKEWKYKCFTTDQISSDEELRICIDFANYVTKLINKYKFNPKLVHWGHAEPSAWNRVLNKYLSLSIKCIKFNWFNLLNIFYNEPIVVKGCLSYGLKYIAKSFYDHGFIKTTWDKDSSCSNGLGASLGAFRVSKDCLDNSISIKNTNIIKNIIKYNEVDCKVLEEIINYLRNNHINNDDSDDSHDNDSNDSNEIVEDQNSTLNKIILN